MMSLHQDSMTAIQRTLLREISDACVDLDMEFVLLNRAALGARLGLPEQLERPRVEVGVLSRDFYRLVEYLEKRSVPGEREVVFWGSDPRHGSYTAQYVHAGTTYVVLSSAYPGRSLGMHVRIRPLREEPRMRHKLAAKLGTAYEISRLLDSSSGSAAGMPGRISSVSRSTKRINWFLERFFADKWKAISHIGKVFDNPKSERVFLRENDGKIDWFDKDDMFPVRFVRYCGTALPIPAGDAYFRRLYGAIWKTRRYNKWSPGVRTLASPSVGYQELLSASDRAPGNLDDYTTSRERLADIRKRSKRAFDTMEKHWNYTRLTRDRFELRDAYGARKARILDLHKQGRYDRVEKHLAEYSKRVEFFDARGLGLCFDSDLLDVLLDQYRRNGRVALADRVDAAVPKEHRVPMAGKSEI